MTHDFLVADFLLRITFRDGQSNSLDLLPSFRRFECEMPATPYGTQASCLRSSQPPSPLLTLHVDDDTVIVPKDRRHRIRDFETGNGNTIVDKTDDGGYQFIIKDLRGHECALIIANKSFSECRCALNGTPNMRSFGLMNAMMLCFSYSAYAYGALLIHASLVRHEGTAYAFTAKSGTGKSTHVGLWLQHIPDCDLMNDDNPVVRVFDDKVLIYGSPWSGKTPCYRQTSAPLGGVIRIDRASENSIERLRPVEAFISTLPSCASMKWDEDIYDKICEVVTRLIERVPIYVLHCRPDEEAAMICHKAIHTSEK